MTRFQPNNAGIESLMQGIGARVEETVDVAAQETADQPEDQAVRTLHQRLNALGGMSFDLAWAQHALETLRRGDTLEISIG